MAKRSTIPTKPEKEVPQTGDDNFIFLYSGLMVLAAIGGSVFAVCYFKKGKYSRTTKEYKTVGIAVISLCVMLAIASGLMMVKDLRQYSESSGAYDQLASMVELPEQTGAPEETVTGEDVTEEPVSKEILTEETVILPTVDFAALKEIGPDIHRLADAA